MSRQYRNTAQWLELIEAFERSGQTQVEFCAALKLNPKYFSKRRSELLNAHSGPAFVQIQTQSMSTPAVNLGTAWSMLLIRQAVIQYFGELPVDRCCKVSFVYALLANTF